MDCRWGPMMVPLMAFRLDSQRESWMDAQMVQPMVSQRDPVTDPGRAFHWDFHWQSLLELCWEKRMGLLWWEKQMGGRSQQWGSEWWD